MALSSHTVRAKENAQLRHDGPSNRQTPDTDPPIKESSQCRH